LRTFDFKRNSHGNNKPWMQQTSGIKFYLIQTSSPQQLFADFF
jgi:hypothetical protein